jgi:hypothetical protein
VTPTYWLASYPKSGNTWFRIVAANLWSGSDSPIDINRIDSTDSIASARPRIDERCLVDTGLLFHDEIDRLRPIFYAYAARRAAHDDSDEQRVPVRLVKSHDAYTRLSDGTPLLAGRDGAAGAVLFVRDPRDVACSFANHLAKSINATIGHMANPDYCLAGGTDRQPFQLRQRLLDWSGFAASWLDQSDIPVHLVRYEDMIAAPVPTIRAAFEFCGVDPDPARLDRAIAWASLDELQRQEAASGFREAPRKAKTFFRRGVAGGWRDELDADQAARIERDHAPMMRRLGYAIEADAATRRRA